MFRRYIEALEFRIWGLAALEPGLSLARFAGSSDRGRGAALLNSETLQVFLT
jgi:hypothetical protein